MTSDGILPAPAQAEELRAARQALNIASVVANAYGEIIDDFTRRHDVDTMPIEVVKGMLAGMLAALGGATEAPSLVLALPYSEAAGAAMIAIEQIKADPLVKS